MTGAGPEGARAKARRRSGDTEQRSPGAATYTIDLGGVSRSVVLAGDAVLLDGVEMPAQVLQVPHSPLRMLRLGDAVYELVAHRGEHRGSYVVSIGDQRLEVEALDERARAVRSLRAATGGAGGPEPVRAPMPGLITKVLVAAGDEVKTGARLIVMEAMKMENELRAKSDARVRAVAVSPGTAVEKGALLVEWA